MTGGPFDAETLLGRSLRCGDIRELAGALADERILITGAAGSIGAQLSRLLADVGPRALVLLDHHEHSLYELVRSLDDTKAKPAFVLGDARDRAKLERLFDLHRPTLVVHLAAYKHVPFGQMFPEETVSVNVSATRCLLDLAVEWNVQRFVYPSSDKAVNPPSLYGATKRIAEVATQQVALAHDLPYCVVRYVNVLGTHGSVIETFARQLRGGEALTVTAPGMTRYWIAMDEAVWLILAAATTGAPADVLMMADLEEIPVIEIARRLARSLNIAGEPEVRFTGLRPGERLREELLSVHECFEPSPVPGIAWVIHRARDRQLATPLAGALDLTERPSDDLEERVMNLARSLQ